MKVSHFKSMTIETGSFHMSLYNKTLSLYKGGDKLRLHIDDVDQLIHALEVILREIEEDSNGTD